jgi:hypothetical protein
MVFLDGNLLRMKGVSCEIFTVEIIKKDIRRPTHRTMPRKELERRPPGNCLTTKEHHDIFPLIGGQVASKKGKQAYYTLAVGIDEDGICGPPSVLSSLPGTRA